MAGQLDPEIWRDLVARYHDLATNSVARFGGHIAQYLGDGVLIYFGFPQAHEDDAERAIRAGLLILDEIRTLNDVLEAKRLPQLGVRIGIHTGAAVVSEGDGTGTSIFGETPNIASRVQAEAEINSVVISGTVHRLVSGLFVVDDRRV
jgi:class 3 adenylate cyclase